MGPYSSGGFSGLKNAGYNLGLIQGPGIASGAVATAAGGAVAGGAGGFGAFGLAGGGATGVRCCWRRHNCTWRTAGLVAAGAFLLVAQGIKLKIKVLDEGITLAVDGMDTLVGSFEKVRKTRFFGMVKRTASYSDPVSEEVSDPIVKAVDAMRSSLLAAADVLGFGSESIESFSTDY